MIREAPGGVPVIDVVEVKSYEATDDLTGPRKSRPAQQLRAVARVLRDMLDRTGDLLIDRRRELLPGCRCSARDCSQAAPDTDWVQRLNDVIDGSVTGVQLQLTLIELVFGQNIPLERAVIAPSTEASTAVDRLAVTRLRLGEADIQRHLRGIVERPLASSDDAGGGHHRPSLCPARALKTVGRRRWRPLRCPAQGFATVTRACWSR